tara:strand:+ start:248 stop:697 length:450 start_codon:yes stop_codon:yes gene_type:complete
MAMDDDEFNSWLNKELGLAPVQPTKVTTEQEQPQQLSEYDTKVLARESAAQSNSGPRRKAALNTTSRRYVLDIANHWEQVITITDSATSAKHACQTELRNRCLHPSFEGVALNGVLLHSAETSSDEHQSKQPHQFSTRGVTLFFLNLLV